LPSSTDPEIVAFLDTLGLRPGARVEVREKHPFDGPLVVRVDGTDRTVGDKVARQIFVRKQLQEADEAATDQPTNEQKSVNEHGSTNEQRREQSA
jgi:DtxR family Mn-dependent transcriptional regulator